MYAVAIVLQQLARLIDLAAWIYALILIGRVICSWVRADPYQPIVSFIWAVTEPVLARIRRVVPPLGGLDFSVLIALVIVQIGIQGLLVDFLRESARQLR